MEVRRALANMALMGVKKSAESSSPMYFFTLPHTPLLRSVTWSRALKLDAVLRPGTPIWPSIPGKKPSFPAA